MDSKKFQGKTPLREACGFVVSSALHNQFDQFKKNIDHEWSILEYIELLQYWVENQRPSSLVPPGLSQKFGKQYHRDEMDSFVVWLKYAKKRFKEVGQAVFTCVSHN